VILAASEEAEELHAFAQAALQHLGAARPSPARWLALRRRDAPAGAKKDLAQSLPPEEVT
jgi:hypothetical protein